MPLQCKQCCIRGNNNRAKGTKCQYLYRKKIVKYESQWGHIKGRVKKKVAKELFTLRLEVTPYHTSFKRLLCLCYCTLVFHLSLLFVLGACKESWK